MRVCIASALAIAVLAPAPAAAAPPRAWPGLVIGYRDLTGDHGYAAAVRRAVGAWNRLALGVRFVPAPRGGSSVQIVYVRGGCLGSLAGAAPTGFQRFGARIVVRSCPPVMRPLLVAHELGRVLGLGDDDAACSLMNGKGRSDGVTYAVPAHCTHAPPPRWLPGLVDPRTAAAARRLYAAPPAPVSAALTPGPQPRIEWRQPAGTAETLVLRAAGRCPTRLDAARGTAARIYAARGYAGVHVATDTTPPDAPGRYCYRVANVSASGRPTLSPPLEYLVPEGPVAAAAVLTAPALAGSPVTFADRSADAAAPIVHWRWDFGDPASGAADVVDTTDPALGGGPAHTFAQPGTYTVTLTVTDQAGRSATATITVAVGSGG